MSASTGTQPIIIAHTQAATLLAAHRAGQTQAEVSPDLGLSVTTIALAEDGARFPGEPPLPWSAVEHIARAPTQCFVVADGQARPIQAFSQTTNWLRSLMPTSGAPTMLVSGIAMHRIKGTDPYRDTLTKIAALAPITGRVLDTATGLGYTAIEAARTASEVVTVEIDPAALEVARLNPWSRALFADARIQQVVGDVAEEITRLAAASFDGVLHDPPRFQLAGDLYSATFYAELYRILRRGGRLFHYVGDPASRSGQRVTAGVMRRLAEVGFRRVERRPEAFGVVASR